MPKNPLRGDLPLASATLARSLVAVGRAIALALVKGNVALNEPLMDGYIPDTVYRTAVDAGWLRPPKKTKASTVMLDSTPVTTSYREAFIRLLGPLYEDTELREYINPWAEPTPSQCFKDFKYITGWSDQNIADAVRIEYGKPERNDREPISIKTIRRIQKPPHNARPEILQAIAAVMDRETAKYRSRLARHWYAEFRWHFLKWRPRKSPTKT